MLSNNQATAVELLFEHADAEVAAKLKIKRETLESWMQDPEFQQAVQDRLKKNRQATVRLLSRVYLNACREIDALIRSDDKTKHKVMVDILKASGLLKETPDEEPDDMISALIRELSEDGGGEE